MKARPGRRDAFRSKRHRPRRRHQVYAIRADWIRRRRRSVIPAATVARECIASILLDPSSHGHVIYSHDIGQLRKAAPPHVNGPFHARGAPHQRRGVMRDERIATIMRGPHGRPSIKPDTGSGVRLACPTERKGRASVTAALFIDDACRSHAAAETDGLCGTL